jgi:hypothetical protein
MGIIELSGKLLAGSKAGLVSMFTTTIYIIPAKWDFVKCRGTESSFKVIGLGVVSPIFSTPDLLSNNLQQVHTPFS